MSAEAAPALADGTSTTRSYLLFGATVMMPLGTLRSGSELLKLIVAAISPRVLDGDRLRRRAAGLHCAEVDARRRSTCTFGSGMWTIVVWNATFEVGTVYAFEYALMPMVVVKS